MIDTHELKKRDLYLNKIIAFQDTEPVKVVTGIRRCGKSSLLKLMTLHLKENGTNSGTLILDATCAPQNISYPQDVNLLNEAREKLKK